jgi:hypothetical protein
MEACFFIVLINPLEVIVADIGGESAHVTGRALQVTICD